MAIPMERRVYRTTTCTDAGTGTGHWRGGQVWAVDGDMLTVRLVLNPNFIGERVCARSLAPQAIVGDAVAVEITGAEDATIVSLAPTRFASTTGGNESVAAGRFEPGLIPPELANDPGWMPWWGNERWR